MKRLKIKYENSFSNQRAFYVIEQQSTALIFEMRDTKLFTIK